MFLKLIHLSLYPNERLVKMIRQHKIKIVAPLILSFLIYFLAFFFLFYFISLGKMGMIFFSTLLFIGALYAFYKFYFWYFNVLILTNKRVIDIDQKKFFERVISDVAYRQIKDVIVRVKGLFQILTHSGTLYLILENKGDNFEIRYVANPEKIKDLILKLRDDDKEDLALMVGQNEKLQQIFEEVKNLDDETLDRILIRLPEVIKEESESLFMGTQINTNQNTDRHK